MIKCDVGDKFEMHAKEPVVVSVSATEERRWGRFQFVFISPYPGGRILLRHHNDVDAVEAYGTPTITFISEEQGKTWKPFEEEGFPGCGQSYPVYDGQFICFPMAKPIQLQGADVVGLEPLNKSAPGSTGNVYPVEKCPESIRNYYLNLECARWDPQSGKWQEDIMHYDPKGAYVWVTTDQKGSNVGHRTTFERPPLLSEGELFYADYRAKYLVDGVIPKSHTADCMVSQDNGKHWEHRSNIAWDPEGKDVAAEPMIAESFCNELVCVIRRDFRTPKSMWITYSKDKGHTWEKPTALDCLGDYGVMPCLVRLDMGIMALSYGRPGVKLSFSLDGSARTWSEPVAIIEGDPEHLLHKTDGYTTMLPIGPNKFLLAYSDFDYVDEEGNLRKAIMIREIEIVKKD